MAGAPRRLESVAPWLLLVLLSAPPETARAQLVVEDSEYTCTIIASTDQFPEGVVGPPSLNASGRVVFTADLGGFTREIHTGVGDLDAMSLPITRPLVRSGASDDPQAFFQSHEGEIINDQGEVLWWGIEHATGGPPTLGIYQKRYDQPFASDPNGVFLNQLSTPASPFLSFGMRPTFNSGGRYLFRASRDDFVSGLFFGSAGSPSLVAENGAGGIQTVTDELVAHSGLQPWYAFLAVREGGEQGLYLNGSLLVSRPFSEGNMRGPSLAGSVLPRVAWAQDVVATNSWELRTATQMGSSVYVDSAVDDTDMTRTPFQTAMNSFGEVVLGESPGEPLLFADGNVLRRVVCRDQFATFGSIGFFDYDISSRSINNEGEIAFRAETGFIVLPTGADEAFIVRAEPFQHPRAVSCVGLPDATPCDDGDPLSVAFCQSQQCVPVPGPRGMGPVALGTLLLLGRLSRRRRRDSWGDAPTPGST